MKKRNFFCDPNFLIFVSAAQISKVSVLHIF